MKKLKSISIRVLLEIMCLINLLFIPFMLLIKLCIRNRSSIWYWIFNDPYVPLLILKVILSDREKLFQKYSKFLKENDIEVNYAKISKDRILDYNDIQFYVLSPIGGLTLINDTLNKKAILLCNDDKFESYSKYIQDILIDCVILHEIGHIKAFMKFGPIWMKNEALATILGILF